MFPLPGSATLAADHVEEAALASDRADPTQLGDGALIGGAGTCIHKEIVTCPSLLYQSLC